MKSLCFIHFFSEKPQRYRRNVTGYSSLAISVLTEEVSLNIVFWERMEGDGGMGGV